MNSKAFELAITALVVIVLGLVLIIGMFFALKGGFSDLKSTTEPFTDTSRSTAIKQACSLACDSQNKLTYCCSDFDIESEKIKCSDQRLEIQCPLSCENFQCDN